MIWKNHLGFIFAPLCVFGFMLGIALIFGCVSDEQRAEIREKIVELIENDGKDAAIQYIDKLVEDGRLGAANAADIKAAIPQGIEKVKEIMEDNK